MEALKWSIFKHGGSSITCSSLIWKQREGEPDYPEEVWIEDESAQIRRPRGAASQGRKDSGLTGKDLANIASQGGIS